MLRTRSWWTAPVGYMYKDKPINPQDSGWRFLSGEESDEYMADNSRHGVYSLNTLANYDRDIIPLLGAAVGSSFERVDGGPLMEIWDEDA